MQRPYERKIGSIACVKLISGEMILGRVTYSDSEDSTYFTVEKPVLIQVVPTGKGFGSAIIPFMGDEVTIDEESIIAECPESAIDRAVMDRYIKSVTGLELATSMPEGKGSA